MSYKKICVNCGKEFETSWPNTKYCSPRCRNEYKSSLYSSYKTMQENEQQTEITPINISGKQKFLGIEIPIIEGGFGEGKRCLTDKTIAEIHNTQNYKIRERINDNIKRFKEGIDYIDLKGILDTDTLINLGYSKQSITQAKHIYLLSERGYAKLIKIMDTDLAWEIHDKLIDEYFTMRQAINQLSKEDKAWLSLKHSEQDENAQYLINLQVQRITGVFTERLEQEMDGEGRKITLSQLAKSLGKEIEMEVQTIDISDFLISKGYLVKRFFQRINNNTGELSYRRDPRGLLYPEKTRTPWMEKQAHKQPTNKFMDEFANKGLALTKDPDARGKIM